MRVLARLFRRLFLREVKNAFDVGKLDFFGDLANLAEPSTFAKRLNELRTHRLSWSMPNPPFGGPEQVLAFGRYTHRVIANTRLFSLSDGKVRFTWKDYCRDGIIKMMTLEADEFIRRFLLHALPDGFHRIRHYGFLANGERSDNLARCRQLLNTCNGASPSTEPTAEGDRRCDSWSNSVQGNLLLKCPFNCFDLAPQSAYTILKCILFTLVVARRQ